ncbi:MAG: sigma 54-interacting transcriptional regulator [Polyangiaceae bacterium]
MPRGSSKIPPAPQEAEIRIAPSSGKPTMPKLTAPKLTAQKLTHTAPAPRLELTVIQEAGAKANRTVVHDGELVRIGAHEGNDLVLSDRAVSRFHCRITREKSSWRIHDTASMNGTHIRGVSVREADLPSPECLLEIGDSRVLVREQASATRVELHGRPSLGDLWGTSIPMQRLFAVLDRVSKTDANVLIEGESGTGKELVATEIVRRGSRADKPFIIVDCGAISPNLIESELFGHLRGSFTGADRDRVGAFESAHGGTVFLDEIGEMPIDMQPKLLRALESREIRRVGESKSRKVDVRVVAATNRRLEKEVNNGRFREDLFFRLSVVTIRVPPLRERLEDLELLVRAFLDRMQAPGSQSLFTADVFADMARYDWPGNVRELRNFVERTVVFQSASRSDHAGDGEPRSKKNSAAPAGGAIDIEQSFHVAKEHVVSDFEAKYLAALVEWADGNVSKAARKAGLDRMHLHRLIQRYGLRAKRSLKD